MILITLLIALLSFVIGILSFAMAPRWAPWKHVSVAVGVFLSLVLALVGLVYWSAYTDPGGRPVSQDELEEAARP